MENGRKLLRWVALAAIAVIGLGGLASLFETSSVAAVGRPDVIRIDAIGQHKALEMPPAVFLHDKHTQALALQGKDCSVCHSETADGHSGFMRWNEESDPKKLEQLFHEGCIGCHAEMDKGPQDGECRACHDAKSPYVSTPAPVKMGDKSLHYLHVSSKAIKGPVGSSENCGACHHIYDEKLQKLIWVPGTEDACAACHGAEAEGSKPSLKDAVHTKCVWCHADMSADAQNGDRASAETPKAASGPDTCAGCHTLEAQAEYRQIADVPRLMRGQPDATVLMPVGGNDKRSLVAADGSGMKPVLFNHKAHEGVTDSCRVCHHTRIESCTVCHTLEGTPESNFVTLAQAMHAPDSDRSCVGCHQQKINERKECAGCHGALPAMTPQSCSVCHVDVKGLSAAVEGASSDEELKKSLSVVAAENLASKPAPASPVAPQDVPEWVEIGSLSDEFAPSHFPHRKIYETLLNGTAGNGMAAAFHSTPTTLCAACHHHTPQADLMSPPKCASCHGSQGNQVVKDSGRPALRAAYHQQCMACHDRMQITKPAATDCAGCHAPLKK